MGKKYAVDYQVPFYETDVNHNVKLPHLLSLALQVSGLQSLSLGVSDDYIFKTHHLVWIITEYDIEIERLPKYGEKIIIETEPTAYNKLFCYRDFTIYGESGDKIVVIHSVFVLMDYESRKVHQVVDDIVAAYDVEKIKRILRGPKYTALENPEETVYRVRYFDLDLNGHVNNSKYLEWMYDVIDIDFLRRHIPQKINLKFVKEVHYGNDIISRIERDGLISRHEIISSDAVRAQARIEWKEKTD
ncbi:acyl-[acyl-carrier-protein] thioesterase [Streptococcus chenjunshii]|uniref:Acyl-[acyl-carrier-protein] thioesterase n=1 Tax=Streptococcus chenjunshii TaxID=2173853 RepID=A0A372KRK8_9STRE|nr:acyl-ACP thioesterase domain-containing protein [Streptococcus chenjunshii]AXQ78453.1 acyl-[acyl-carrier-protein] thioesterase [Streptococcus chenjunshii]RFU52086.1 acyl-[acyl-carrier-protein] thioesterase [Streptococcus chenjunshii]RFU54278.1 acyl-[acyl-carrier-protein] thioesterase [Streptococcus chenjunshii]